MCNNIIIILRSLEYKFVEFDGFDTKQEIWLLKNVLNSSRIRNKYNLYTTRIQIGVFARCCNYDTLLKSLFYDIIFKQRGIHFKNYLLSHKKIERKMWVWTDEKIKSIFRVSINSVDQLVHWKYNKNLDYFDAFMIEKDRTSLHLFII